MKSVKKKIVSGIETGDTVNIDGDGYVPREHCWYPG